MADPLNAAPMAPAPGIVDQAKQLGTQAMGKAQEYGAQAWDTAKPMVGKAVDFAKGFAQNPMNWDRTHALTAAGVGAGALLTYMLTRKRKQQHEQPKFAAANWGNIVRNAANVARKIPAQVGAATKRVGQMAAPLAKPAAVAGLAGGALALSGSTPKTQPAPTIGQTVGSGVDQGIDKVKSWGGQAVDWAKNNPGTALGIGGGIAASALLAHLLSRDDSDDSDE